MIWASLGVRFAFAGGLQLDSISLTVLYLYDLDAIFTSDLFIRVGL